MSGLTVLSYYMAEYLAPIRLAWFLFYFACGFSILWSRLIENPESNEVKMSFTEHKNLGGVLLVFSLFIIVISIACKTLYSLLWPAVGVFDAKMLCAITFIALGLLSLHSVPLFKRLYQDVKSMSCSIAFQTRPTLTPFSDVVVSDVLTSLSGAISYQLFHLLPYPRSKRALMAYWLLYSIPAWIRFRQCLSDAMQTSGRTSNMHMLNAVKYFMMVPTAIVIFTSHKGAIYTIPVVSLLLSSAWDSIIDWGLWHKGRGHAAGNNVGLIIVSLLNLVMRFSTIIFVCFLSKKGWQHEPVSTGFKLQLVEVLRRLIWTYNRFSFCAQYFPEAFFDQPREYGLLYGK